jgi:hypothetical protein
MGNLVNGMVVVVVVVVVFLCRCAVHVCQLRIMHYVHLFFQTGFPSQSGWRCMHMYTTSLIITRLLGLSISISIRDLRQ